MKVASANATQTQQHGQIASLGDVQIGADSIAKLFSIITERMYEDPIRALTRELLTNMVDAHMQYSATKGRLPTPGIVSLPTPMRPSVKFHDYGPGMSPEEIEQYVCHILRSSKDQSNEFHGGWGLGMKSPFSYTRQWSITTRQNGFTRQYATFMQDTGVPTVSQLGSPSPTAEPDGLTIEVPVKQGDFGKFSEWIRWYAHYLPEGFVEIPGDTLERPDYDPLWQGTVEVDGFDWTWRIRRQDPLKAPNAEYKHRISSADHYAERVRIILGAVPYIDIPNISEVSLRTVPLDLYAPIGSLTVTPDRDRLSADASQIDRIHKVLRAIHEDLTESFLDNLEKQRPWLSVNASPENKAYAQIQNQAFKKRGTRRVTHNGFHFDVFSTRGSYQVDGQQLLTTLQQHTTLSDSSAHLELRQRDYNAPSQMVTNPIDALTNHAIDHTLQRVYYDDVGRGSIGRFQDIGISKHTYSQSFQRKTYLFIYASGTHFTNFNRDKVAQALGLPTDMVRPISDIPEPEKKSAQVVIAKTPETAGNELHRHPLVSRLGVSRGWSNELVVTDWPWHDDPTEGLHYYIQTNRSNVEKKDWPYTTASQSAENWYDLRYIPSSVWDLASNPIVFLPGTVAKEISKLPNWKPFFTEFDQRLISYIEQHYPLFQKDRLHQRLSSKDPIGRVREMLSSLRHLAEKHQFELPAGIQRQIRFYDTCLDVGSVFASVHWLSRYTASLLGVEDIRQQTRRLQAHSLRVLRRYPMLPMARKVTEPGNTPRNKEAVQHILRAITRRAPQRSSS